MNHLIVAQYNEDVSWVDRVEGWAPLIVKKGRDLRNEGRECSSFYWGINRIYEELDDESIVACVQGNPFAHDEAFPVSLWVPVRDYTPLGGWSVVCDMEGNPHHPNLPLRRYWDLWIRTEQPDYIRFTAGGQFMVTGAVVRNRPRDFYRRMVGHMSDRYAPWCMERLWGYLFR